MVRPKVAAITANDPATTSHALRPPSGNSEVAITGADTYRSMGISSCCSEGFSGIRV